MTVTSKLNNGLSRAPIEDGFAVTGLGGGLAHYQHLQPTRIYRDYSHDWSVPLPMRAPTVGAAPIRVVWTPRRRNRESGFLGDVSGLW